jgi:hypothetical protein
MGRITNTSPQTFEFFACGLKYVLNHNESQEIDSLTKLEWNFLQSPTITRTGTFKFKVKKNGKYFDSGSTVDGNVGAVPVAAQVIREHPPKSAVKYGKVKTELDLYEDFLRSQPDPPAYIAKTYLKKELVAICKSVQLKPVGSKLDLAKLLWAFIIEW